MNLVTDVGRDWLSAVNCDLGTPIFSYCDHGIIGLMDEASDTVVVVLRKEKAKAGRTLKQLCEWKATEISFFAFAVSKEPLTVILL